MKFIEDEPDVPAQINIVSTIDVIFAILAFFIISSLFLSRNEGLPVNLPEADQSEIQTTEPVAITVTADSTIFVGNELVELEDLPTEVLRAAAMANTDLVVLNADASIRHGLAIAIIDRLRSLENIRLAIATQSEPTP
ncbi:MAG: biopolymer transporter ExbD [Coleofasciculaceae cyanobacterium RL_1_1]|nr:biopolymer transporter ExbD [Coleofasciculaceae cyanobacterium RL_1_1]